MNEVKLDINDYVFKYLNKEIYYAKLSYEFDDYESAYYNNGIKTKEKKKHININIMGTELHNKDNIHSFDFELNSDLNYLNSLDNKITNINDLIGEIYFDEPNKSYSGPCSIYKEDNIKSFNDNVNILKIDTNKFIFNFSLPTFNLYIWFKMEFENEK